jgi:hypothetical protein
MRGIFAGGRGGSARNAYTALSDSFSNVASRLAAINQAVLDLHNAGGGTLELARGTWVVMGAIRPLPGVTLVGRGQGVTTLRMHKDVDPAQAGSMNGVGSLGSDANLVTIDPQAVLGAGTNPDRSDIRIAGLTLDWNATEILTSGASSATWTARINGAAQDNVGNCIAGRGGASDPLRGIVVEWCDFLDAGFHGAAFYYEVECLHVLNSYAKGCGYRAIHIHGDNTRSVKDIYIHRNRADGCGTHNGGVGNGGIYAVYHNVRSCILTENHVFDDKGVGIHCWGASASGDVASRILTVANNISERNATGFLFGAGTSGMAITGNVAADNRDGTNGAYPGAKGRAFDFSGIKESVGVTFNGNVAHDNDGMALYAKNLDGFAVTGNVFVRNNRLQENQAVVLSDIRHSIFSGNTVFDNGRTAAPSSTVQLMIEGTVATNATETAGTDELLVASNLLSCGQRANAAVVQALGGTAAAPNCRSVTITGNKIRRPLNAAGAGILLTARNSNVVSNDTGALALTDQMTPGSTNGIAGNF